MTLTDHTQALSKAIHSQLEVNPDIGLSFGSPARLYDTAPEDPIYPYLTYGAMRAIDKSADGALISNHQVSLHIWSRYAGRSEVLNLLNLIEGALLTHDLNLDNASEVIGKNVVYADVLRAPDGRTLHGLLRLSFTIETNL